MFSIRESTMCFSWLWSDLMWFGCNAFRLCSVGLHSVLADYVVNFFTAGSKIKNKCFLGGCTWSGWREYFFLPQESGEWVKAWLYNVRINKDFPPQSFSSGHTKGLPIGIILSFVLLTSMKLPSLVFFCLILFYFFMLYVVTIWGVWLT